MDMTKKEGVAWEVDLTEKIKVGTAYDNIYAI